MGRHRGGHNLLLLLLYRRWRWTGSNEARALAIVAAGTAQPERLRAVVDVVGDRPVHHEVEDRRVAHHLDRPLEGQIREALPVAPGYHVAGFQTRRARCSAFSRTLCIIFFFFILWRCFGESFRESVKVAYLYKSAEKSSRISIPFAVVSAM